MTMSFFRRFVRCVVALSACLLVLPSWASEWSGKDEMNGYSFKQYEGFWNKWKLVTVRYRQDNKEIRFIYANEIAWRAMQQGRTDYPNGSVFAKVGFQASTDPLFESSLVPGAVARYQLMVMDKAKHKDTHGWGYAIFDGYGKTMPENPVDATKACAACHEIAAKRGYVFASVMQPSPLKNPGKAPALSATKPVVPAASAPQGDSLVFETVEKSRLGGLGGILPKKYQSVRIVTGKIRETLFSGTLSEIKPALIRESTATGQPAALISADLTSWSVVFAPPEGNACPAPSTFLVGITHDQTNNVHLVQCLCRSTEGQVSEVGCPALAQP